MSNNAQTELWLALSDAYAPLIEAVAGHRAKLEAAGFSPTAAEMMSIDFHRSLMASITSKAQT